MALNLSNSSNGELKWFITIIHIYWQVRSNKAIVKLVRDIGAPVDIELQLNMNIYGRELGSDEIFYGTAISRIYVYITDDPW